MNYSYVYANKFQTDGTLRGTTTPGQSGPRNERGTPKIYRPVTTPLNVV